jgi:hypothetical protein
MILLLTLQDEAFAFSGYNFVENLFRLTVGLVLQYVYLHYLILPHKWDEILVYKKIKKLNSVAFSLQANYTDRATAACWRS